MDAWLFQFLRIYIIDDGISCPCPGLIIVPHLADAQTASHRKYQIAVLDCKIARTVSHTTCPAYIQRIIACHAVLTVPADSYRNPKFLYYPLKYRIRPCNTDSISRIQYRAFCLADLFDDLFYCFFTYVWSRTAMFPLIGFHIKFFQLIRLYISPLDI